MTTSRIQFFATPDELAADLAMVCDTFELKLFVHEIRGIGTLRPTAPRNLDLLTIATDRLYLAPASLSWGQLVGEDLDVSGLGLIQVTPPLRTEKSISMCELAIKFDAGICVSVEDRRQVDSVRLLSKLRNLLKMRFIGCVVGINARTGREAVYKNVKYTKGAVDLHERGCEWVQQGVENVRFRPA